MQNTQTQSKICQSSPLLSSSTYLKPQTKPISLYTPSQSPQILQIADISHPHPPPSPIRPPQQLYTSPDTQIQQKYSTISIQSTNTSYLAGYLYIVKIFPAFDESIVCHQKRGMDYIVHYDKNGGFIFQKGYQSSYFIVDMLSQDKLVIVLDVISPAVCQIIQLNLIDHSSIMHQYPKHHSHYLTSLFIFPKIEIFCVYDVQPVKSNMSKQGYQRIPQVVHLTYYKYPLTQTKEKEKDVGVQNNGIILKTKYKIKQNMLQLGMKGVKVNEDGMICLIAGKGYKRGFTEILAHELIQNNGQFKGSWNIYYFQNSFHTHQHSTLKFIDIYEIQNKVFHIRLRSQIDVKQLSNNKIIQQIMTQIENKQIIQNNYSFIWHYKEGVLRPTKFRIMEDYQVFILGQKYRMENRCCPVANLYERLSWKLQSKFIMNQLQQPLPIYYIDFINQRIMAISIPPPLSLSPSFSQTFTNKTAFSPSPSNPSIYNFLIQIRNETTQYRYNDYHQNRKDNITTKIQVQERNIIFLPFPIQEIIVYMMEEICQGCDEDLIWFVVGIFGGQVSQWVGNDGRSCG